MAELSEQEAFRAMIRFLEGYYERTKSDDVGALLGDSPPSPHPLRHSPKAG